MFCQISIKSHKNYDSLLGITVSFLSHKFMRPLRCINFKILKYTIIGRLTYGIILYQILCKSVNWFKR
jgi:hypothetical protein